VEVWISEFAFCQPNKIISEYRRFAAETKPADVISIPSHKNVLPCMNSSLCGQSAKNVSEIPERCFKLAKTVLADGHTTRLQRDILCCLFLHSAPFHFRFSFNRITSCSTSATSHDSFAATSAHQQFTKAILKVKNILPYKDIY